MASRKSVPPATNRQRKLAAGPGSGLGTGQGGETHQVAGPGQALLTSNQGVVLADNQNSLHGGDRGPTLLEDFLLREKITHFDHERIPERIVHARGSAAHGYFECLRDCSDWTKASFLSKPRKRTPVFTRFSTVAGGAGSVDTPRDVRGFAVKFYTDEGNFDLVGNNIPVFFIQDAMKFPDLVHSVKMEPDRAFPQAASAHDTFWDFISLMPESLHMIMWAMSDRAIPRSLRMIDGFGVHTFRLVNAAGQWRFVKFHWRAALGVESTTWDEAVKIAGADPDYHRRDLWESIERGDFPVWELGFQVFDQATADRLPFDVLDPTKVIPEELVPIEIVGRMVLDRNPDNFFAETEQVAFCPSHLVPGFDFSNDPLLQGRLFSYLDTQLKRLGTPNFHQLPINAPKCPFHNLQRDAQMQMMVPKGRVNYEPSSLDPSSPRESPQRGFNSLALSETGPKARLRPESFADHYSQARLFFRSMTPPEQYHMISALGFELGKVETPAVRERVVAHLLLIDDALARGVMDKLGLPPGSITPATPARPPQNLPPSPALSQVASRSGSLKGRHLALLVAEGADAQTVETVKTALEKARARVSVIADKISGVTLSDGTLLPADGALAGSPSCLFGAVVVLGSEDGIAPWLTHPAALDFLRDAWRHLKAIGLDDAGQQLAQAAGIGSDDAVVALADRRSVARYLKAAGQGKFFAREGQPGTD
ncbi:catalase [Aquincola sp. MAHUQ-54]|uniref:Catalase n=1 Tax=Aquincola agrisoli TaxID=3119538 RepID=A0AAW9QMF8_9BURK